MYIRIWIQEFFGRFFNIRIGHTQFRLCLWTNWSEVRENFTTKWLWTWKCPLNFGSYPDRKFGLGGSMRSSCASVSIDSAATNPLRVCMSVVIGAKISHVAWTCNCLHFQWKWAIDATFEDMTVGATELTNCMLCTSFGKALITVCRNMVKVTARTLYNDYHHYQYIFARYHWN